MRGLIFVNILIREGLTDGGWLYGVGKCCLNYSLFIVVLYVLIVLLLLVLLLLLLLLVLNESNADWLWYPPLFIIFGIVFSCILDFYYIFSSSILLFLVFFPYLFCCDDLTTKYECSCLKFLSFFYYFYFSLPFSYFSFYFAFIFTS